MSDRDPLKINQTTIESKYEIERLVGEGGFAVVYRARHVHWNKPVAMKFFSGLSTAPESMREQLQKDFINEGALLTELSSHTANIVQARDVGFHVTPEGQWVPYMVLEWLDGEPLDELLERERKAGGPPWRVEDVYRILMPIASALDVAHARGIAHRDIKPANLFVLGDPRSGGTLKLLDFGVAKMMSDSTQLQAALAKTGLNVTSFTPQYGAPEQFSRSYGATGPWTDVYALALVAVEMVTGRPALDGEDVVQLAFSSGNPQRRPTPRTLGARVNDAVEAVFQRALAIAPKDRFARAGELWQALAAALGGTMPPVSVGAASAATDADYASGRTVLATGPQATPIQPPQTYTTGGAMAQTTGPVSAQAGGKGALFAILGLVAAGGIAGVALFALRGGGEQASAASAGAPAAPAPSASVATPASECPPRMAKIAAGQFFMGSEDDDPMLKNAKPAHNVSLDAYCIDLYEVTMKEYRECSDSGKCRRAPADVEWPNITPRDKEIYGPLCNARDESKDDHPANCVDWSMADRYCKAHDKRLPTEAEWEYATRGPDGRTYPWGDEAPTAGHLNACGRECIAWHKKVGADPYGDALYDADDGFPATAPVGKFPAGKSRFGPYDVVGNVWEWTADYYADYTPGDKKNPTGPESGEKRVVRGGAFNGVFKQWLRPSYRYSQVPAARSYGIGFRCARSP